MLKCGSIKGLQLKWNRGSQTESMLSSRMASAEAYSGYEKHQLL